MIGAETFPQFFIKLHRASSLHSDFRLEHDRWLKSWVLPPDFYLYPTHTHEAVSVADHQLRYGSVERVIPSGQYGAGPMLLWDYGTWLPFGDVDQGLRDGHLRFQLQGRRLNGTWSLLRRPVRCGVRGKYWDLQKEEDAEAWPLSARSLVAEMPTSVLTGRNLDEVAADPRRVISLNSRKNGPHGNQPLLPFA